MKSLTLVLLALVVPMLLSQNLRKEDIITTLPAKIEDLQDDAEI